MTLTRLSLVEIRGRFEVLAREGGAPALRRLRAALRGDPRAGARAVAEACSRVLDQRQRERRRVRRLFALRRRLHRAGLRLVAGVDEVGVGPLAGPVVAAAVVLPERVELPGLDDSKRLSRAARERLDTAIRAQALGVGVGVVEPAEIDRINIYRASLEAMRLAVRALPHSPDHLVVDARTVPGVPMPQTPLPGADRSDGSVAAASIVAKVYRDALLRRLDGAYPGYDLARNKGYPTAQHVAALRALGPSPVHRRSFAPVAALLEA
ncbi:MAG: ribonuclease HII [Proteobacteria bacterium]|nr:ribonuclease HII [Pseudomonadota bacterium]